MFRDLPAEINIETSMTKAIELYPLTKSRTKAEEKDHFLRDFSIRFHTPIRPKATMYKSSYAPHFIWFAPFEESDKIIMVDEYAFYGIKYETTVMQAKKRISRLIQKVEKDLLGQVKPKNYNFKNIKIRKSFTNRDELKEMEEGLCRFEDTDAITLSFIFSEWPSQRQATQKDYIEEFERKILNADNNPDELPF